MGNSDLSDGYKQTAAMLRRLAAEKTSRIKEMEQQEDESILSKQDELSLLQADRRILNEMVADCERTIEWLGSGRRPGNKRGIERRAAYQREKLMDPVRMQAYVSQSSAGSPANLLIGRGFRLKMRCLGLAKESENAMCLRMASAFRLVRLLGCLGSVKEVWRFM